MEERKSPQKRFDIIEEARKYVRGISSWPEKPTITPFFENYYIVTLTNKNDGRRQAALFRDGESEPVWEAFGLHCGNDDQLAGFVGSTTWHQLSVPLCKKTVLLSDGARYVLRHGNATWLMADIVTLQDTIAACHGPRSLENQAWVLTSNGKKSQLVCFGKHRSPLSTRDYSISSFPLAELELHVTTSENTLYICLASEN